MIYLPLKGEKFNGFDFVQNALDAGASGYFTESADDVNLDADVILLVEDTKPLICKLRNITGKRSIR